jgi:hypothetical protein
MASRMGPSVSPFRVNEYFDVRRHAGVHRARQHAVLFQGAQLKGEHALGDAGYQAAQFIEAPWLVLEMEQDRGLPPPADHLDRRRHRAPGCLGRHARLHV